MQQEGAQGSRKSHFANQLTNKSVGVTDTRVEETDGKDTLLKRTDRKGESQQGEGRLNQRAETAENRAEVHKGAGQGEEDGEGGGTTEEDEEDRTDDKTAHQEERREESQGVDEQAQGATKGSEGVPAGERYTLLIKSE